MFQDIAMWARPGQLVVLHLRAVVGDKYGADVNARAIQILRKILPRDQPLHLHCFSGTEDTIIHWLNSFPNSHFGSTGGVSAFNQRQWEAVKIIPQDKLLLETDAPYLAGRNSINSPSLPYSLFPNSFNVGQRQVPL